MKITQTAIEKPVFAWMIMAAMIFLGLLSLSKMGVSDKPDIDYPNLNISIAWEGAAPEVIELDILDYLESALLSVEGVKTMSSEARRGQGNISLEFGLNKNIDVAVQEVQAILGQAMRRLPSDVESPVVRKSNPEDRPIMWLSVSSETMTKLELMTFVRDQVKDRFSTTEGVSEVILGGYVEPNLRVWVNKDKLNFYEFSIVDIVNAIQSEHRETPAGTVETDTTEYNLRVLGEASTLEDFEKISIKQRGGRPNYQPIKISEVARIEDALDDQNRISRVNKNLSIGLGIKKQSGANSVAVANQIREKLEAVKQLLPEGMKLQVNYDGTKFIEDSINELKFTLVLSGLMTALVVFLFLNSFTSAFNIILSIPTAIIACFIGLNYLGYTLNTFTMLGLTLAIGMIVDDNIMILENINRFKNMGYKIKEAALLGTNEISFAALAASTAIIAIFLPLSFISGITGAYFNQFAMTICIAIGFSFLDAVTLTPMRASHLFKTKNEKPKKDSFIDRNMKKLELVYSRSLDWALGKRNWVLIGSLLIIASSFLLVSAIKKEFIPSQDQSRIILFMKTKAGSSLKFTDEKVKLVEDLLLQQGEVLRYFVNIGGFSGSESNTAFAYVTLKDPSERPVDPDKNRRLKAMEFADKLKVKLKAVPGIMVFARDPSLSGFGAGGNYPVEFSVIGPDWKELISRTEKLKAWMSESELLSDVDSSFKGLIPELHIIPNRKEALLRDVSIQDIGTSVQSLYSGIDVGKFAKGGRRYDIKVKLEEDQSSDKMAALKSVQVRNNRGELSPLKNFVSIEETTGLMSITRTDRSRAVSLTSNLRPGVSQGEALKVLREKAPEFLGEEYLVVDSGSSQSFNESFSSIIFVLVIGILLAYMILASQFNSFLHPITIISALPFSFTGAFLALYAFDQSLNVYSLIGLVLLMGIVKKNSIILVDFTNQLRTQGADTMTALRQACPVRLRPILMTSLSTVAGTIPAALSFGPGSETRVPMALAVIGGLLFSTFLSLYLVPCVYSLIPGKVGPIKQ